MYMYKTEKFEESYFSFYDLLKKLRPVTKDHRLIHVFLNTNELV